MTTWIGFLRAINLGATRKFAPREIVACLEEAGFTDLATHINTGNVRLRTTMRSRERITAAMERAFAADRGFEVPVMLLTPTEVRAIVEELDEVGGDHDGAHHVSLMRQEPSADAIRALEAMQAPGERIVVRGRAAHLLLRPEVHRSRLGNGVVEKVAGPATSRNRAVLTAIAAKWC